ncbi:MAG: AI-2E family transporter [bacterium]
MTKEEDRRESYRKTAALFLVIVVLILSFLIVRPFLIAILSAAALAYIFYPLYQFLLKKIPKKMRGKELGAILTCLIIILIVLIPAVMITTVVTMEAKNGYRFMRDIMHSEIFLPPFLSRWSGYMPQIKEIAANLAGQLFVFFQGIVKGIPNVIMSIFIIIFSTYYFLKHGRDLYSFFSEVVPLPEGKYKQIIKRFDDLSRGMIMGQVVVGVVQGVLSAIGFALIGVPGALLLGALTAIISIIPLLGAAIIWVPVDIYLFLNGMMTGNYLPAVSLLIYGTFVISSIDNILKPKIVGDHAKVHPLIVLFGILGGIQLFGLPGILIGPLILTIFDLVIEIYKETL